jgi:exopolysaccharide biosynthesis protein
MIIAPRSKYDETKESLRECTGAGFMVLSDGRFPGSDYVARDPRTGIGYTEDGIVWLLNCDGRKSFGADGMTYKEMGYIFQALGCTGAANMDGGGSAQMLIRHPIAGVWQIRNSPADGAERPVINGWAVIVDEP